MHRRMWLGGLILAVAVAMPVATAERAAYAQQRQIVVVAEPTTIGVDPASAATFAELLRSELARSYNVVTRSRTPQEPCGESACGAAIAVQTGAGGAVALSLSQLGQKVIVNVTYVDAGGRTIYSDRATGGSVEDLEPLAARIAIGITTGKPLGDTAGVNTVTANEAKEPQRKQALFTSGLVLGIMAPMAGSYGDAGALMAFGALGMFELDDFAFVIEANLRWSASDNETKVFGFDVNGGGRWFMNPEADTGTFFEGGLGFRFVGVDTGVDSFGEQGLGVFAGVGAVLFRTSDFHLLADLRYDVSFFELDGLGGGEGAHGIMATLGFSYKNFGKRRGWF